MAGIEDCYTSARGQTATLGNFGKKDFFLFLFYFSRLATQDAFTGQNVSCSLNLLTSANSCLVYFLARACETFPMQSIRA